MRPIIIILVLISLLISRKVIAQTEGQISGTITSNTPLKSVALNATITLITFKDSAVVAVTQTKEDGSYNFSTVPHGNYLLSVTAVAHLKRYSKPIEISATNYSQLVPPISLKHLTYLIEPVTITR